MSAKIAAIFSVAVLACASVSVAAQGNQAGQNGQAGQGTPAGSGNQIYRCGNEYTNNPPPGLNGCKLIEGGNVTVVRGTRQGDVDRVATMSQSIAKMGDQQKKQRDNETRQILQQELAKAQARQSDLLREYNNGEPDRVGPEFKNYQMYQDRVAQLKANLERNQNDIVSLQRELDRLPPESK